MSTTPLLGEDARLSPARQGFLGLQHLLVSNIWLDPIFIASAGGLGAALGANLISVTFLVAGLVTLLQTVPFVKLPIVEGPSSAFSPIAISYAGAGSLPAASLGLIIGAVIVFFSSVTGLVWRMKKVLTPAVTGTIILLVGLSLTQFGFSELFGGTGSPDFGSGAALVTGVFTLVLVGVLTLVGRVRSAAFIIALVAGDIVAALFGRLDFSPVGEADWVGLPDFLPYGGLHFDLGITVTMCIIFFVAVVEALGIYEATAEITGQKLTRRKVSTGIAAEAGGTAVAGLFGGFGATAYAQNLGVIRLTRVTKLSVVRIAAVGFIALAFLPKFAAVLAATPPPVVGGLLVAAAITVIEHGAKTAFSSAQPVIAACAVAGAMGIPALVGEMNVNDVVSHVLTSSVAVGAVIAVVLQLALRVVERGDRT